MVIVVIEAGSNSALVAAVLKEVGLDCTVRGSTVRTTAEHAPWSLIGYLSTRVESGDIKSVYITK